MALVLRDTPLQFSDVTPESFVDVDLSADVPSGAVGVVIRAVNLAGSSRRVRIRSNGSTHDIGTGGVAADVRTAAMTTFIVACDTNRIIEVSQESADIDWYLIGYFDGSHESFDTNPTTYSPTAGAWNDVDISSQSGAETAVCAFGEATTDTALRFNVRKNGSTDNRTEDLDNHGGFAVGVDGSEIFEANRETTGVTIYVHGWGNDGAAYSFLTNALDRTNGITADQSWQDLAAVSADATGAFFEIDGNGVTDLWGLRRNGSTESIIRDQNADYGFGVVKVDGSRIAEGARQTTNVIFYEMGISLTPAGGGGPSTFPGGIMIGL